MIDYSPAIVQRLCNGGYKAFIYMDIGMINGL